jgi:hypothetical protein
VVPETCAAVAANAALVAPAGTLTLDGTDAPPGCCC